MKFKSRSKANVAPSGAEYLSDVRFHKSFILPANPTRGRPSPLRASYCDLDYRQYELDIETGDTGPTLLYLPGAGESRYTALWADALAERYGIRYLHLDRFGLGGTDEVDLQWRVEAFMDLIEELLKNLRIKHVALASHSAGAIYSFNFALKLRHLLHPINPLICFMAPWVSPEHSKVLVCSAARFLPSPILRQFYILEIIDRSIPPRAKKLLSVRRLRKRFSPHKQISGEDSPHDDDSFIEPIPCNQTADDIDGSRPDSLSSKTSDSRNVDTASGRLDEEISLKNGSNIQVSGVPLASNIDPELEPDSQTCSQDRVSVDSSLYFACKFSEKFKGMSEDLLLCLRRKGITSWGSFSDYDEAIKLLQDQETRLLALDYQGRKRSRLRVETFLAGQDSLIGKKGATWFDKLWEGQEEWVEYDSEIIEGFEHNQIPTRRAGCLEWIMDMTAWAWERAVEENGEDVESLRSR